jgi:hypothetical protein
MPLGPAPGAVLFSDDPMIAEAPRVRKSIACKCAKEGAARGEAGATYEGRGI